MALCKWPGEYPVCLGDGKIRDDSKINTGTDKIPQMKCQVFGKQANEKKALTRTGSEDKTLKIKGITAWLRY